MGLLVIVGRCLGPARKAHVVLLKTSEVCLLDWSETFTLNFTSNLPRVISNVTRFYGNRTVTGVSTAVQRRFTFLKMEL